MAYTGVPNLSSIPDRFLKMATLNAEEVETEALAFALKQLSIFENRLHANELLEQCGYDGRKLAPLLDAIEAEATAEDILPQLTRQCGEASPACFGARRV